MNSHDTLHAKGIVTATICDISSSRAQAEMNAIVMFGDPEAIKRFHERFSVRQYRMENLIPTVGRQQVAKGLTGNLSVLADIEVNYSALGTGTTAPVNGNTQLGTETYRKTIASLSYSSNIAYLTAFYAATDTNGTFYEHGIFMNGTASANTGTLLSRVLLNSPTGIVKSAVETLTIEHAITLT